MSPFVRLCVDSELPYQQAVYRGIFSQYPSNCRDAIEGVGVICAIGQLNLDTPTTQATNPRTTIRRYCCWLSRQKSGLEIADFLCGLGVLVFPRKGAECFLDPVYAAELHGNKALRQTRRPLHCH